MPKKTYDYALLTSSVSYGDVLYDFDGDLPKGTKSKGFYSFIYALKSLGQEGWQLVGESPDTKGWILMKEIIEDDE